MKIKYHHAWTWKDSVIYGAGFIFAAAVAGLAGGALLRSGASALESYATLLIPLAFLLIPLRLYQVRRRFVDGIAFTTYQGVSVVPGLSTWIIDHDRELAEHIEEALEFWQKHYAEWDRLEEGLNGYVLVVNEGPVNDPKHGIMGKGELTWDGTIAVAGTVDLATFFHYVRHGIGHVCAKVMGEKREHHAAFRAAGWRDA
jgi:hypothetical protein